MPQRRSGCDASSRAHGAASQRQPQIPPGKENRRLPESATAGPTRRGVLGRLLLAAKTPQTLDRRDPYETETQQDERSRHRHR